MRISNFHTFCLNESISKGNSNWPQHVIEDALKLWKEDLPSKPGMLGPLFHGTKKGFSGFDSDFERTESKYDFDMPDGYVFLTTDPYEARFYGSFVVPCYIKNSKKEIMTFKVASWNPSQTFDDDYNWGGIGMWNKFEDSRATTLEVRGTSKSTFITYPSEPEIELDLAMQWDVSPNERSIRSAAQNNKYIKAVLEREKL